MRLTNFVLAFCLISAIHCARFKRDDTEEPVKEPEKEIEPEPSKPPETETGESKPGLPDFGAWFGQFYGSGSENKDFFGEAQNMFKDPSKWDPSKWVPKLPSK